MIKSIQFFLLILFIPFICPPFICAQESTVRIGSKKFTESVILGEIINDLCINNDLDCIYIPELGGTAILWNALLKGDIDIYPEYTGTLIYEILSNSKINNTEQLKNELKMQGILMTSPLGFNNTYAIGMKDEKAKKLGITKISDLKKHPDLKFGFTNEFMDRSDGWPGLKSTYSLRNKEVTGLDHDIAYKAIGQNKIDVTDLYTTDAEIEYLDLTVLTDDKHYFKDYYALILYREELSNKYPGFVDSMKLLEGKIDEKEMISMNTLVKINGESEKSVAAGFLNNNLGTDISVEQTSFINRFKKTTKQHLFLVIFSLTFAILISLPLGIIAYKYTKFGQIIHAVVGIIQTIPSLALLVFMIPLFGIGTVPALAALFLYSLLPIVRNTYSGLKDIPSNLHESADALGISASYKLFKIELPLASRTILSGIKTSAVINVGVATLGALIGAGGYGQPILTGIRLDNITLILEGAVPAALLALIVQGSFDLLEKYMIPRGLR